MSTNPTAQQGLPMPLAFSAEFLLAYMLDEGEEAQRHLRRLIAALASPPPAAQPTASENGGRAGWPPGMLQDDSRGLSRALASKPDAPLHAREAAAAIAAQPAPAGDSCELRAAAQAILDELDPTGDSYALNSRDYFDARAAVGRLRAALSDKPAPAGDAVALAEECKRLSERFYWSTGNGELGRNFETCKRELHAAIDRLRDLTTQGGKA